MAVAALIRSVATKLAQPPHPRPLLARGLHGSGSRPGGSLPTSLAGRGLLQGRALHSSTSPNSGSTPPPTSKTDLRAILAKTRAGVAYFALVATSISLYTERKESRAKLEALYAEMFEIQDDIQAIIHANQEMDVQVENIIAIASQDRSTLRSGHGEEPDGASDKRTRICNLEEKVASLHRIKELEDVISNLQVENTKLKVALESASSEGKV